MELSRKVKETRWFTRPRILNVSNWTATFLEFKGFKSAVTYKKDKLEQSWTYKPMSHYLIEKNGQAVLWYIVLNFIVWGSISKPIDNERSSPSILYGVWVPLVFPTWDSQLLQYAISRWCLFGFTYLGSNTRLGLLGSDTMLNLIVWGSISKPIGNERSSPSILYGV